MIIEQQRSGVVVFNLSILKQHFYLNIGVLTWSWSIILLSFAFSSRWNLNKTVLFCKEKLKIVYYNKSKSSIFKFYLNKTAIKV